MSEFDVKKVALNISEDTIKNVITNFVKPYAKHLIEKSENKFDDAVILPFLDMLEAEALKLADKIDNEIG